MYKKYITKNLHHNGISYYLKWFKKFYHSILTKSWDIYTRGTSNIINSIFQVIFITFFSLFLSTIHLNRFSISLKHIFTWNYYTQVSRSFLLPRIEYIRDFARKKYIRNIIAVIFKIVYVLAIIGNFWECYIIRNWNWNLLICFR